MSGLDVFAWVVLLALLATVIGGWAALARLPGAIARKRGHPQAEAIAVAGWLGAILFMVFWPLALVWAYTRPGATGPAQEGGRA